MAKRLTPIKAIRAKCLDCSAGSAQEVKLCVIPYCPLFEYRFGKNPSRKGMGSKNPVFAKKTVLEQGFGDLKPKSNGILS